VSTPCVARCHIVQLHEVCRLRCCQQAAIRRVAQGPHSAHAAKEHRSALAGLAQVPHACAHVLQDALLSVRL
jgi:hypothetical protein